MDLETASDSAIPRQSLTSAVADKLRDQIIRGEIPEGAQLRQDAIATQYQVSRIPVRDALRQLDAEGLIAIVPNRGAVVPALSPDDIEELFSSPRSWSFPFPIFSRKTSRKSKRCCINMLVNFAVRTTFPPGDG